MSPNDQLPDDLVEHLRRDRRTTLLVPREIDRAVLRKAEAHFRGRDRREAGHSWRRYLPVAAGLLVAVVLARQFTLAPDTGMADIDGSGQVNILDAFALARRRAGGDTTVSQARIDELAGQVVSLSRAVEQE